MTFKSLRRELLFWLLMPLAVVAIFETWITYRSANATAVLTQERLLMGSARIIAEQVGMSDDGIVVQLPPAALELFANAEYRDRVFYRVTGPDGKLLAGYYEMMVPGKTLRAEESLFFDTEMRDEPVHAVAFAQPLFAANASGPVLIEVGQTLHARDALAREIWRRTAGGQLLVLALVAGFLWFGLRHGLSSVVALRNRMLKRKLGSLEPLSDERVPSELQPLVASLNDYVARLERHMSAHSRFIADASHQLRTPLTVLNTQVTYALRTDDAQLKDEALKGIRKGVQNGMRLVNQLLAFTEAEADSGPHAQRQATDISAAVREVLESLALLAEAKRIDLGFENIAQPVMVWANQHVLVTLIGNLVDNAIRYIPAGGVVTVRVAQNAGGFTLLRVEDNGPGIPAAERERVFERFYRLSGSELDGCGLGLAIVRELVDACGATIELSSPAVGTGLVVTVSFPPPPTRPAAASAG